MTHLLLLLLGRLRLFTCCKKLSLLTWFVVD